MPRLHKIRGLFFLEISKNMTCVHQHLMLEKTSGETICMHCGRTIYMRRKPDKLLGDEFTGNTNSSDS
ncbi:MAG: hypothetical protein K0S53_1479 [Bacteroidetes bacterium]|jgi:hypothetical protein|nr:hypothetical protein [Bacteroidota bacterium]MDF2451747.1 hypothetical protein [Bacteroidota bacterium]